MVKNRISLQQTCFFIEKTPKSVYLERGLLLDFLHSGKFNNCVSFCLKLSALKFLLNVYTVLEFLNNMGVRNREGIGLSNWPDIGFI